MRRSEAMRLRGIVEQAADKGLDDEMALAAPMLFPGWGAAAVYETGQRVRYEGILYRCLQGHSAQADWSPTAAPSLWARVLIEDENVVPEWVQPESTNPYSKGDRVRFEGKVYESLIDGNIWSPAAYPGGWKEITE